MSNSKPRGYFEKVLAIDVETSGIMFGSDDPSYNPATGDTYQVVSIGLVVTTKDFVPVETLYLEIKWDGESLWDRKAEQVHGLSIDYLEENGLSREDAVAEIGNLIIKYWGPDVPVCVLGHNVATFDLCFLRRLLRSEGIEVKFGNRTIDTNTIGNVVLGTFNSDDTFAAVGLEERDSSKHNALDDAKMSLACARFAKEMWKALVEPELE